MSDAPRVVCITGATSGIGSGLVAAFLDAGDQVHACGRDPGRLDALGQRWAEARSGARLILQRGDLVEEGGRAALVAAIAEHAGRLDVLVNNAGVILDSGTLEESIEHWRATLEINLIAPFALTQACAGLLAASPAGVVINMGSACSSHPFESCTSTSYSVSKAGLDMLTRRLAMAMSPRGIRVNAVAPGVVETPMWGGASELMAATAARRHRLGGEPVALEDVAEAVLFLASERARRITGAILEVDAGYRLG